MLLTLADLIGAKYAAEGSWKPIVERSDLSLPLWNKLEAGSNTEFPATKSIRGLALGLQATEREVIIAAAVGLGFDMHDGSPQLGRLLPDGVDDLSEDSKRILLDMARTLVRAEGVDPAAKAEKLAAETKAVRKRIDAASKR